MNKKSRSGRTRMPVAPPEELLRSRAEKLAREKSSSIDDAGDAFLPLREQDLQHELQVHQIELEIQNEELRRTLKALEASQARYFDLYHLAPVGYLTLDEQGFILEANLTAAELLGLPRKSLIKQPFSRFILHPEQDRFHLFCKQLLTTGKSQSIELHLVKPKAPPFWARLESKRSQDADRPLLFQLIISDIDDSKQSVERMRQASAMFATAREGVMVTDPTAQILIVNRAFCELTGYSEADVLGRTPRMLQSGRQDEAFYDAIRAQLDTTGYWQGEIWSRRKNGEVYPQMLSISAVLDDQARVTHYVAVFADLSQIKDATERLEFLAHHDVLTGLPNRLLLFSRLKHSLDMARRDRKSLALLMLDLDRFKDVNDSFGHLAGDELLQQVAERLTNRLRGIDTVTRLGGDEFAVLLEDISHPQDAALVATEIIDALGEPFRLSNSLEVRGSASIGISLYPEHGNTAEELLKQADAALYRAKSEGRGHFSYFSDDLTYAAIRRINLETLLRRALARHELSVHYQPQIDIRSGQVVGAEALVRWYSETEGDISPNQFIPVAEETGLIALLGEWVLREACRQGRRWIDAGLPPLRLAVNLSSHQLRHGDISETVASILAETGFPPERLELELTESALMERESEAASILQRLRGLGVRLAIDDFGTGYSSLAYLKRFQLDMLKIDRSFIEDIPQQQDDLEIAAAIIAMGHTLRLQVLAEGVETAEQFDFLKAQGCDLYQGYFNSPALPPDEFAALLRRDDKMNTTSGDGGLTIPLLGVK